jgi:hypothetical protein
MTTTEAHALIRKASNGAELDAFLDIIAKAAANGTLEAPEADDEAPEAPEADEDEADEDEADEADDERLAAEIDF